MPVKCQITLPDTVIRTFGFREHETEPALKKRVGCTLFSNERVEFWPGEAARRVVSVGLS